MILSDITLVFPIVEVLTLLLDFRLMYYLYIVLNWPMEVSTVDSVSATQVEARKKGHNKMADVDVNSKQRMVVEFLTAESVSPEEIHARLKHVYGADTVDFDCVKGWYHRPGESDMTFGGRLVYRAVIQFLTAEGEKPLQIAKRLSTVYRTVSYSGVTVWRWAKRYLRGDTTVGDRYRQGRLPYNVTSSCVFENSR